MLVAHNAQSGQLLTPLHSDVGFIPCPAFWREEPSTTVSRYLNCHQTLWNSCHSLRMFTSSLMEEVKSLEEDIEAVKEKVDDPMMCEKVRLFIYAPQEIQQFYKEESRKSLVISIRSD
jgi:predicted  nucleic acid-binding Zn ribbon protein